MEVTLKEITIRDLVRDYKDHDEEGITGYGGRLDIRPHESTALRSTLKTGAKLFSTHSWVAEPPRLRQGTWAVTLLGTKSIQERNPSYQKDLREESPSLILITPLCLNKIHTRPYFRIKTYPIYLKTRTEWITRRK